MDVTHIKLKKGLDLPIQGVPEQSVDDAPAVTTVGVVGGDYIDLKPTMYVEVGDKVKLGQPLFEDKRRPGVLHTAPAAGEVIAINRGARRVLQSVVIRIEGNEQIAFKSWPAAELASLPADEVREQLRLSGMWTALRTRPYSRVPRVDSTPAAIFVPCIDTRPLAADPVVVLRGQEQDFKNGLAVLTRLTAGEVFVCRRPGAQIPVPELKQIRVAEFDGPHPAGLVGTHMHFLKPVGANRTNWYVSPQDVAAIGKLFTAGKIDTTRIVALGGPQVVKPRLLRTRIGACISELITPQIRSGESRPLSGSILGGREARGWGNYLGRYHTQISVLAEGRERRFLGWINPAGDRFSAMNLFFSAFQRGSRRMPMNTSTNGSPRAMVPIGNYERVLPLDMLATPLLRALLVRDTDTAQSLGALELDEEDLALCSFVCVGKHDYGPILRANLEQIETEG
ncbi:Na(+)-translocating NADH-quinone reductase subunit A [Sinimarinibacterium sp. CAU 1509]|uniref:Na(+)-translocating NADH-quinone reductase subunit A n=1 Tax=Sinimarinibacterium sp. CAU 1509 TaxID=2562283 RepID=UPI00200A1D61|nr:Na(+)-translocating NADH-quinone reductase subunit A [Sinimarinibacterium sp. CAU 1509]